MKIDQYCGTVVGNLEVLGWETKCGSNKKYIVRCSVCAQDPELFGDGTFPMVKQHINRGRLPCGCAKNPRWSAHQYRVLVARAASGQYTATIPDDIKCTDRVGCVCSTCNYTWNARIDALLNSGHGCARCGGRLALSSDEARSILSGICDANNWKSNGFVGRWKNTNTHVNITCNVCLYSWSSPYTNIVHNKSGCASCAGIARVSEDGAITRIDLICRNKSYIFDGFVNGWSNIKTKVNLRCAMCDHEWVSSYTSLVHANRGCPCCSKHGYDPSSVGFFYIYKWTLRDRSFLKYGITSDPSRRLKQQMKYTAFAPSLVLLYRFEDGSVPLEIERIVDRLGLEPASNKEEFADGYTETIGVQHLDQVKQIVEKFKPIE